MFDEKQFEFITKKYGHYASWALWADEGKKPKDNIGDISILDIQKNKDLLKQAFIRKAIIFLVNLQENVLPADFDNQTLFEEVKDIWL